LNKLDEETQGLVNEFSGTIRKDAEGNILTEEQIAREDNLLPTAEEMQNIVTNTKRHLGTAAAILNLRK